MDTNPPQHPNQDHTVRITRVDTLRTPKHPNVLWVQIHTDAGITGLGETWFGAAAAETDIHDRIAPLILGQNATRIEYLNRLMHPYVGFCGTGAEIRALSAVDIALWDIAGKAAGVPLYQLLGGATRSKIPLYNTCAGPDYVSQTDAVRPDNFGTDSGGKSYQDLTGFMQNADDVAASLLEMGIDSMKIWPFDFAAGATDGLDISNTDLKKALEPFEKVRNAHGDKMKLKAELHGLWSLAAAQKICNALEPLDIDWVEDPIWMDRLTDINKLQTTIPLAAGETLGGLGQIRTLIDTGNITTPIIDLTWGGGITFARKSAALAESHARSIAFHDCSGPVTLTASVHLAMAATNVREQEFTRAFYYGWYGDLLDRLPPVSDGFISAPEGDGLGVLLSDEVLVGGTVKTSPAEGLL